MILPPLPEFLDDIQLRLQRTQVAWASRLEDFSKRLSSHEHLHHQGGGGGGVHRSKSQSSGINNPLMPLTPFRVLLQLFADEDVMENGKLDFVFELDDGTSMTFFVPQLLSFLLHGAFSNSQRLEGWILDQCRRNVYFAHRCYWFLRAWCLEVPAQPAPSRQNSESRLSLAGANGSSSGLSAFLDEPVSPEPAIPCRPSSRRRNNGARPSSLHHHSRTPTNEKLLPEERVLIERLMLRVKECGESSAAALAFGDGKSSSSSVDDSVEMSAGGDGVDHGPNTDHTLSANCVSSPSEIMSAAESGAMPIDPRTGFPSVKHLDCVSARGRRYGFMPLDSGADHRDDASLPLQVNESHISETEQFDKTPQFLDALIFLADSLFQVPTPERKAELRKQLRMMECELLPSNAVYMPIGNVHHRVWRIVADESIPIGTRERVPCFVCLEVVDFTAKRPKPRAWSFLDRLPKRGQQQRSTSTESHVESMPSLPPLPPQAQRRATSEGIELSDLTETESETIDEWRYGRRDPLRRTSLFDKVTSSVVDSMKTPLDKMKALRVGDRTVNEELRALVMGEEGFDGESEPRQDIILDAAENGAAEATKTTEATTIIDNVPADLKKKQTAASTHGEKAGGRISRVSSGGSLLSMGQWMTPEPAGRTIARPSLTVDDSVRRRLDRMGDDSESPSLPYGSDHEEDFSNHEDTLSSPPRTATKETIASNAAGPTKHTHRRRPPVVFRESWQSKQDRIRKKSTFGTHPGWRLLTIMIKANDDLRQEQLACQLIYRMAAILAREKIPVWLCPYEIIALTESGGIVEAIPDTISIDSLKRNDPNFRGLKYFFLSHFGHTPEEFADAQANFVESLAAYSIVCFLLQLKDRHNGNILLDNRGHVIHIDYGFYFLSSPGKNAGFESAPFKLTRDFVEVLGGPNSRLFRMYRELCVKTFITLRRHCMEIILLVEMLKTGNEELNCFRGRPDEAIRQLRERFRLDLNDRACKEYVNSLVDDSIENWRTDWYDRYQRYCVGVL